MKWENEKLPRGHFSGNKTLSVPRHLTGWTTEKRKGENEKLPRGHFSGQQNTFCPATIDCVDDWKKKRRKGKTAPRTVQWATKHFLPRDKLLGKQFRDKQFWNSHIGQSNLWRTGRRSGLPITLACFKRAGQWVIKVCGSLLSLSRGKGRRFLIARLQQAEPLVAIWPDKTSN
jgi:hypothetical protein